jgi:hypothetical protein
MNISKNLSKKQQKLLKRNPENDARKALKQSIKIPPNLRLFWGSILEPFAWLFPAVAGFFGDLFFGTFAGTPKGDFGHPFGGMLTPWERLYPPFWNYFGIPRRFLVLPPFRRACQSSETVRQIRKCHTNTSQTHDTTKASNESKSYLKNDSLSILANKSFLRFSLILQRFRVTWWATPFLAIMFSD